MKKLLLAACLCALASAGRAAAADIVPHPDKLTYKPFSYVPPAAKDYRVVLKSGVVAYLAENHELPLVNISITLRGGKGQVTFAFRTWRSNPEERYRPSEL